MELKWGNKTYCVEWDSIEEVYIFDEDGNDVPYDYELYLEAEQMVREHYVAAADFARDRLRERA